MTSTYFMVALAVLQALAAIFVFKEGNTPLAVVYSLYGGSNLAMIWVHLTSKSVI
jgi:hypothetical protein